MSKSDEIIDLTVSICANHNDVNEVLIVLDSDDSICSPVYNKRNENNKRQTRKKSSTTGKIALEDPDKSKKWNDCPICLDELGKRPLASTKCGHVFCWQCLEKSLQSQIQSKKRCPTCRRVLKGPSDYHPLYLYHS